MNKKKIIRVHFVPQGLEFERILAGILEAKPERVIIIRNTNGEIIPHTTKTVDALVKRIEQELINNKNQYYFIKEGIDTDSVATNFFDFPEAFSDILRAVRTEKDKGNTVTLSIASGTKIIAIAMYIVGLLTESDVIYIIPSEYVTNKISEYTRTTGINSAYIFPHLAIQLFHNIPFDVLEKISIADGEVKGIKSLLNNKKDKSEQITMGKKIDVLEQQKLINTKTNGLYKIINITELGLEMLKMKNVFGEIPSTKKKKKKNNGFYKQ